MTGFTPLVTADPLPQVRACRAPNGLIAWDTTRTSDGFVLVAPSLGGNTVYLVDLMGQPVHTWRTPYSPGLDAYLTDEGTLFFTGKTPAEDPGHFIANQAWKGGWAGEIDWDGNILWSVEHPFAHHSAARLANGNVLLICLEPLPSDVAARIPGGRRGTEWQGTMFADVLIEMTTTGEQVRRWRLWEQLVPEDNSLTAEQEDRTEWTHCNSAVELPNGDFLVSFRVTSQIAIVDRKTGEITWSLGAPLLAQQHAPYLLDNGNILLFDNGTHRQDHYLSFSRVLEIVPETKDVIWSYQDPLMVDFFSPLTANAQRLPGGNTLVTEATFGRIFEVTSGGEVVWEFISPWFVDPVHNPALPAMNRLSGVTSTPQS